MQVPCGRPRSEGTTPSSRLRSKFPFEPDLNSSEIRECGKGQSLQVENTGANSRVQNKIIITEQAL